MIHLTAIAVVIAVCVPAAADKEEADRPRLVDEVSVFAEDDVAWRFSTKTYWPLMRLSPDGRKLLYLRRTKAGGVMFALTLRDLATGEDQRVPMPPVATDFANFYPRIDPFDSAGNRMVLTLIDKDVPGETKIILWKLGDKKSTDTPIAGRFVYAEFDRTGKRLIVNVDQRLWFARPPQFELEPTGASGVLWSRCPTQDLIAIYTVRRLPGEREPEEQLILYDLEAKEQRDVLPLNSGGWLDDLKTKWTQDGRHLYYADPPEVRVWDRAAAKIGAYLDASYPVGPGPGTGAGESTMVLKRVRRSAEYLGQAELRNIVLHNAATGEAWELGDTNFEVQDARAGRVVYLKHGPGGRATVHLARIVMPAAGGDE